MKLLLKRISIPVLKVLPFLLCEIGFSQSSFQVTNYSQETYNAANQNWDLSIGGPRTLYAANNKGLLIYNGANWQLIQIPGKTIIRSVLFDNNKVYVGSFEEFGYFTVQNNQIKEYHSLSKKFDKILTNQEYWKIVKYKDKVYFQSFGSLFTFDGNDVNPVFLDFPILFLMDANNELYVQQINGGLYRIINDKLIYLPGSNIFNNAEVKVAIPLDENKTLFGTKSKGVFLYDGENFSAWHTSVDNELTESNINNGVKTNNSICFGTILKGIYQVSLKGDLINHIDIKSLQNNTILSLETDNLGNLWVGMDKGISYISFNSPFDIYTKTNNSNSVYSAYYYKNELYVGTNQGIFYYTPNSDGHLIYNSLLAGSQGQTWFIKEIEGELYCGLNDGTYKIKNHQLYKISSVSGGYNLVKLNADNLQYIQSTYSSLVIYRKNEKQGWVQSNIINNFSSPSPKLEIDFQGNIWVGHSIEGITKLQPDKNYSQIVKVEDINTKHGLPDKTNRIYKIDNRIVIPSKIGLLRWNDLKETFEIHTDLNKQLQGFEKCFAIISLPDSKYWFIKDDEWGLFEIRFGKAILLYRIIPEMYNFNLVDGYENIVSLNDSLQLICLDNGFAIFNIYQLNRLNEVNIPPTITEIKFWKDNSTRSFTPKNTKGIAKVPSHDNNLTVSFASNEVIGSKRYFQYRLVGIDKEWSKWQSTTSVDYTRLPHGTYKFQVRTINSKGIRTNFSEYQFIIEPPFYQSWKGYILYSVVLILLFIISKRYYKERLKKQIEVQKKRQEEKIRKEREESEKTIIKLQNDKLQSDIQYKNSQLALSTMSIVKKNELLMEISNEIENMKKDLGYRVPNKYYDKISKLITQNIENEHDWEIFEKLFDQAHENFFKRLKDFYPTLTPSDLRLCAYLRMNLSSKEIAPLLNITIRGVEERRYRLRKRLNLTSEESLNNFIINF